MGDSENIQLIDNYIIYKHNILSDSNQFKCGKVKSITHKDGNDVVIVDICNDDFTSSYEEDIIELNQIVCNLLKNPTPGTIYNRTFKEKPKIHKDGDNLIKFYIPKHLIGSPSLKIDDLLNVLTDTLNEVFQLRSILADKTYEINIEEGDFHKSNIKKAKVNHDYILNLKIYYDTVSSIREAVLISFSQLLWKFGSIESKSDWIKLFTDDLIYDKIDTKSLGAIFIKFINGDKKDLERDDELVSKLILKEIKRIKCLSLNDIKLLLETRGEACIIDEFLPDIINGVKIKNSIRISPLIGMTPAKKFGLELKQYLITNVALSEVERTLKLFFD